MAVFCAASRRLAVGVLAAVICMMAPASSFADEQTEKALLEQLRIMQQRMDELAHEVQTLKQQVNPNTRPRGNSAPQPAGRHRPARTAATRGRGTGPCRAPSTECPRRTRKSPAEGCTRADV